MKPCFQYTGAKVGMASQIAALFPDHKSYVEPYVGSAAVLLAKPPVPIETINDVDETLINFYCVLRDPNTRHLLIDALTYTPYARAELAAAVDDPALAPVERARRFFVRMNQRYGGFGGWVCTLRGSSGHSNASKWNNYRTRLSMVAERLQSVQIEGVEPVHIKNEEAVGLLARVAKNNDPTTAVYLDPPYLKAERHGSRYDHDDEDNMHDIMLDLAVKLPGPVVVSAYPHELYQDRLRPAGWREYRASVKASSSSGRGRVAERTEVLWANPQCKVLEDRKFRLVAEVDANGDPVDVFPEVDANGTPVGMSVIADPVESDGEGRKTENRIIIP